MLKNNKSIQDTKKIHPLMTRTQNGKDEGEAREKSEKLFHFHA
jgi:hypothetical protein